MGADAIQEILKDLPRHGALVKNRPYRQVWRFVAAGKPYYLKFYPRRGIGLKRTVRGNPAMREFLRLQQLQRAEVPAPRGVSALVGFNIAGRPGDAVIIEGLEPSVQLDNYLNEYEIRDAPIPNHHHLANQVVDIVHKLGHAKLGHSDLHLGNFLLHNEKLYLLDAYSVHPGGLRLNDVLTLGQGAARFATRADLWRAWKTLAGDQLMPTRLPGAQRYLRKFQDRTRRENDWFGKIAVGDWSGHYFKAAKHPAPWSAASELHFAKTDWQRVFPKLLQQIETRELKVLKTSPSSDVWAAEIAIGESKLPVVIKRPYKRYWYRYINEIGRGSRSLRAWDKAWRLIARQIPTAWPLLVMQKRKLGYITESIIVFERVAGPMLAGADLNSYSAEERENLFRRTGRILRQIDSRGLSHFDAKSTNWIVVADPHRGPTPILIDVDGVRRRKWIALGIQRLLRSMRDHPQYTPADSLALCKGYAPFTAIGLE